MITNHRVPSIDVYRHFDTAQLRTGYRLGSPFAPGEIKLVYTDLDRAIVGAAVPTSQPLVLQAGEQLKADYFCERRELGVINIGAPGSIRVDGKEFKMASRECLYVACGSKEVSFSSDNPEEPAMFYLLSYPAHTIYPTTHAKVSDANVLELGSQADANHRQLHQYIHINGIRSCQLVMGFTELQQGSVWNTMPSHTHDRRTEIYCYFDIAAGHRVAHFMGEPSETRVLWLGEKEIALSPSWSIHSGAGTGKYSFIWGMGGENQRFDDMDPVAFGDLK